MNAPVRVFVGLGSNLEDPARQVALALAELAPALEVPGDRTSVV